ncbi:biotin transporter BioY [Aceticella autotrophica]|uniref:biotin transporter BioY n=1 Tax=Aceticella autotrophica TaxID=2755338 RepID=UPI003D70019C
MKNPILSVKDMVLAALFAALTFIMGFISIPLPFSPVPITGQTFAVMLAGNLLNPLTAFFSLFVFDLLGAVGIPVFAGLRGGLGILLGPTGGYLIGFPIAALVISLLLKRRKLNFITLMSVNIIGLIIIYLIGVSYLSIITGMNLNKALIAGVYPFIPGDLIKIILTSLFALKLKPAISKYMTSRS